MKNSIRFAIVGAASALALIYGCQDEKIDGSPSASGPVPTTVFADDFSDGVRRDRWRVEDERHTRGTMASTGPALIVGPTTTKSASTFTPRGRTEVHFDVGVPLNPANDGQFRFLIDPSTFFEVGFDFTGRVLLMGAQAPIALSGPGNHTIIFVIDQFGDAHWFIDGALVLSGAGFPLSPFGLGLQGSGSSGFIVDNVLVRTTP